MATKEVQINVETVVSAKREYLSIRQKRTPPAAIIALADMQQQPNPVLNLVTDRRHVTLIGQIRLTEMYDPVAAALRYVRTGVNAVSLFTDKHIYTQGMDDLLLVSRAVRHTPVIAQDFILNTYHVAEARASGASALTLYSSILEPADLRTVVSTAMRWRMTAIVQVSDEEQMERAAALSPHVIAIGEGVMFNRERDLPLLQMLHGQLPFYTRVMPMGCIFSLEDAALVLDTGVDAIIVDETLTRPRHEFEQLTGLLEAHSDW